MKIVQTFWTGATGQPGLSLTGGWLSSEYHWMAWALSVLQLRQFYDHVELVTDELGKHILIDLLQLPYTHVRTDLQTALQPYPQELWALAKIYSYSIQDEPFLHVDGDVFIWKAFDKTIEKAELVAQNFEIDLPFYHDPLAILQSTFKNIPPCMLNELTKSATIFSSNAGVIGGRACLFFQEYKTLAFSLIDDNLSKLVNIPYHVFNMCLEQYLYHCLAKEKATPINYVFTKLEQSDPTYPGFANFHKVPFADWFIHCMADYKRQEVVVWHLANRLRQDYPSYYYRILRACQQAGLPLHNKAYDTPELSPSLHTDTYFEGLPKATTKPKNPENAVCFYGKSMAAYRSVEALFSLPLEGILKQKIGFDTDATITEETEPTLKQTLNYKNPINRQPTERVLDNLGMVLYDTFSEPKPIGQAIEETSLYFPPEEIETDFNQFQNLVLDRIKDGMYLGTLRRV